MKKLLVPALVSCAFVAPSLAYAQFTPRPAEFGNPNGYSNRGQCESALMQARNEGRKNANQGYTADDYNYYTGQNFECRKIDDRYYIYQIDAQGGEGRH